MYVPRHSHCQFFGLADLLLVFEWGDSMSRAKDAPCGGTSEISLVETGCKSCRKLHKIKQGSREVERIYIRSVEISEHFRIFEMHSSGRMDFALL